MPHEIEAKYPVRNLTPLRRRLRAVGAVFLGTVVQTDRFYDLPDGTYHRRGCGLRLRSLQVARRGAETLDVRPEVTFKGPLKAARRVKVRREIQTRLDDERSARLLLAACGLVQTACYRKRRSRYRLGQCRVELDEVPSLGTFVEIEGPDERTIEAVRDLLRIETEHISASYLHLLAARGLISLPAAGRRRT